MQWSVVDQLSLGLPDGSMLALPRDYEMDKLDVRVGYMYDPTPVPATRLTVALPDKDRHDISAGATYRMGNYHVDLGVLWVLPGDRDTADDANEPALKGTFSIDVLVAALSVGARY